MALNEKVCLLLFFGKKMESINYSLAYHLLKLAIRIELNFFVDYIRIKISYYEKSKII